MLTRCTNCGEEVPEGTRYCTHCGTHLEQAIQLPPTPEPEVLTQNIRTWAMLCHLISLSGFIVPLGNILGPLFVWLFRRKRSPFINTHGKEALNFQISIAIYSIVPTVALVLEFFPIVFLSIAWAIMVLLLFGVVKATIRANRGLPYRYPFSRRFIK